MNEHKTLAAICIVTTVIGCAGGEPPPSDTTNASNPPAAQAPVNAPPVSVNTAPTGAAAGPQVAEGDSIFHGQKAGGLCYSCHGPDAKGTQLAPDLTDSQWLNGDGSLQFITNTVKTGVPHPKQHPAPMPPMGGAQLTPQQIAAVASYVYSLSHPHS